MKKQMSDQRNMMSNCAQDYFIVTPELDILRMNMEAEAEALQNADSDMSDEGLFDW